MKYTVEELKETFLIHHEESKKHSEKVIKEYQKDYPGEPIPDHFYDDFSITLALSAICDEIIRLKE